MAGIKRGNIQALDAATKSREILAVNFQTSKDTKDWRISICGIDGTSENVILRGTRQ